jgi:hypothetical protein
LRKKLKKPYRKLKLKKSFLNDANLRTDDNKSNKRSVVNTLHDLRNENDEDEESGKSKKDEKK